MKVCLLAESNKVAIGLCRHWPDTFMNAVFSHIDN